MGQVETAETALRKIESVLGEILAHLAQKSAKNGKLSISQMDRHQIALCDLTYSKAEVEAAKAVLSFAKRRPGSAEKPSLEEQLALIFTAETIHNFFTRYYARPSEMGIAPEKMAALCGDIGNPDWMKPEAYEAVARDIRERGRGGDTGLGEHHEMLRDTFKKFAESEVMPRAEHVHREDRLIPEEIMAGLREMGCFGLSIPTRYGGFQDDAHPDHTSMAVVTEELSRGSLGVAGSLITRPEILSKAILKGGTEAQKAKWLPLLASGERMAAVAATEPDYGSDVASMKVSATRDGDGWRLKGCKTWCTFAGYADSVMVLARTDPDPALSHRGLSILIAEKPRFDGHEFTYTQPDKGGTISGKAIATIGYRGMHSFEVHFDNYYVPGENLIGGDAGLGQGFYYQMAGFSGGRLQTAARANGVMQAAFEKALAYAMERSVFGKPIFDYQITQYKIARMAALIHAARHFTYAVSRLMDEEKGQMEASLVKLYASRMSEWVTREAVQIHGGMGYAEEYAVSRYFVDARVFSIFEGAEETLILRVVARQLLESFL